MCMCVGGGGGSEMDQNGGRVEEKLNKKQRM